MGVTNECIPQDIVSVLNNAVTEYFGNSLSFLVLFVSCMTLLIINKDTMKRGHDLLAVDSVILWILFLFNSLFLNRFADTKEIFVLLPLGVIIAYVICKKCFNMSNRLKTNSVIIALTILILVASAVNKFNGFTNSVNIYKVDDQGVLLADFIDKDAGGEAVSVCFIFRGGEHLGDDVSAYEVAEQYSGFIKADAVQLSEVLINPEDADYLVINNEIIGADVINKSGYELTYDTGYYSVFVRTN